MTELFVLPGAVRDLADGRIQCRASNGAHASAVLIRPTRRDIKAARIQAQRSTGLEKEWECGHF
jgi:hypothetical protein